MKKAALLAAAALAWTGCDYWRNLVEGKAVDRRPFTLAVIDAWTGEAVGESACRDLLTGESLKMNRDGERRFADASLGPYAFECTHPPFFPRKAEFELGIHSEPRLVVTLARKPGADWYPGVPERQVGHGLSKSQVGLVGRDFFRVPGTLTVTATPWDTNKSFLYAWKFSGNTAEERTTDAPVLSVHIKNIPADTVVDTIGLGVMARFPGMEPYALGNNALPITFVKNKKPDLKVTQSRGFLSRGCASNPEVLYLTYLAHDSDGSCDSITFSTGDRDSPIENLPRPSKYCPDSPVLGDSAQFHLKPYRSEPGIPIRRGHTLIVKAWDDNGEYAEQTIPFETQGNISSFAEIQTIGSSFKFVEDQVAIQVTAGDVDSKLTKVSVDWGDSSDLDNITIPVNWTLSVLPTDTILHQYLVPSPPDGFKVTVHMEDLCKAKQVAAHLVPFNIIANSWPEITLAKGTFSDSLNYLLMLNVVDKNISSRLDTAFISVNWGDSTARSFDTLSRGQPSTLQFPHTYSHKPGPNGIITILVWDTHNGLTDTTLSIYP